MIGVVVLACLPGEAVASWYYRWSCNGGCAPGELSISGVEGPFSSEAECNTIRDGDDYHRDLVLQPGNFGLFESCHEEDGGGGGGSGSSSGYSGGGGGRGGSGPPELRLYAAGRLPAFDRSIKTGKTMAGVSPAMLEAGATVDLGVAVSVKIDFPKWSGGYLEVGYLRNGFSYQGTSLGVISGGYFGGGYQRGRAIGRRCGAQWSFGFAGRVLVFSASEANTELAEQAMQSWHMLADTKLAMTCRLTRGGTWLDLGLGTYYSPTRLSDPALTSDDPDMYIETSAVGASAGLGITFVL